MDGGRERDEISNNKRRDCPEDVIQSRNKNKL